MASAQELSDFFVATEKRAFKHAAYALRNDDAALDLVQDAMVRLAEKYGDRPATELPLLFQRILQNLILDWFRRQKVRSAWVTLFSQLRGDGQDDYDVLEALETAPGFVGGASSADEAERGQILAAIDDEISKLPARQREAFLLRYWEDLDVAETAVAMGCSEGSVKTHCSRATHALAAALRAKGIHL